MTFLHKDEFQSKYKTKYDYPVVLTTNDDVLDVLLSADAISRFDSVADLIHELQSIIA